MNYIERVKIYKHCISLFDQRLLEDLEVKYYHGDDLDKWECIGQISDILDKYNIHRTHNKIN